VQRWEYQTWRVWLAGDPDHSGGYVGAVDGETHASEPLSAALRQAGDEGWELAAVVLEGSYSVYTFKRPKE
jgi:hypothetical protein